MSVMSVMSVMSFTSFYAFSDFEIYDTMATAVFLTAGYNMLSQLLFERYSSYYYFYHIDHVR